MSEKSAKISRFFYVDPNDQSVITKDIATPQYTIRREKKRQIPFQHNFVPQHNPKKLSFIVEGDVFEYLEEVVKSKTLPQNAEIQEVTVPNQSNAFKMPSIENLLPDTSFYRLSNIAPLILTSSQ